MKTINCIWLNNMRGIIGVVLAQDEFKQQAYICACGGIDQDVDLATIKDYGTKLNLEQAKGFFGDKIIEESYGSDAKVSPPPIS